MLKKIKFKIKENGSFTSISLKYFFISGSMVLLSYFLNILFVIKMNININYSFIFCFVLFNYISYFLNAKINFKKKIALNDFSKYMQNTIFTFITSLFLINFLDYFFFVKEIFLITTAIFYSSILNFILNSKLVFNYNFFK